MYDALLEGLYSESEWPTLGDALAGDAEGNGAPIVAMSNSYVADGSTNGADAGEAIDCLDHPVSKDVQWLRRPGDAVRHGGSRFRSPSGLGAGRLRRLAGAADPQPAPATGRGLATHTGGRHDAMIRPRPTPGPSAWPSQLSQGDAPDQGR